MFQISSFPSICKAFYSRWHYDTQASQVLIFKILTSYDYPLLSWATQTKLNFSFELNNLTFPYNKEQNNKCGCVYQSERGEVFNACYMKKFLKGRGFALIYTKTTHETHLIQHPHILWIMFLCPLCPGMWWIHSTLSFELILGRCSEI